MEMMTDREPKIGMCLWRVVYGFHGRDIEKIEITKETKTRYRCKIWRNDRLLKGHVGIEKHKIRSCYQWQDSERDAIICSIERNKSKLKEYLDQIPCLEKEIEELNKLIIGLGRDG